MEPTTSLYQQVEESIAQNLWAEAYATLREQWHTQPNVASAAYVVSRIQTFRDHLSLIPRRLAILRSFTVEPVVPLVRAGAFVNGIDLNVQVGQFNALCSGDPQQG